MNFKFIYIKMVQILKNILLKIFLIIGIMQYSFEKAILEKKWLSNENCNKELGRYLFEIIADLSGNLSQSDFEKIKIEAYNPNLIIHCDLPDKNSGAETIEVSIPCYIENFENYQYYSFSFRGESDELQLINFEDISLNIFCKREMPLALGEIKEQVCDDSKSKPIYSFKIEILNNTIIPERLMHYYISLTFLSEKEEYKNNNPQCFIESSQHLVYLDCKIELYEALDNSLYLREDNFSVYIDSNLDILLINNDKKYIGKDIFCYDKHKVNYLDIFKGYCKNGAFYFSIDLEDLIDDEEEKNEMLNSKKLLIELKGKVDDAKSLSNFCYLENKNEQDKYDLSKYKLNCAVPTLEDTDNRLQIYNLFSKYYVLNYLSLLLFNDELYCFKEKDYITAFYFYSDECSNNNTFKILAVTTFNELNVFNSTLDDKIEIPIISPFNDIAICKISSLLLEPFTEFICSINNNQININDYEKITFGNITTEANYDDIYPIEFDDFSGEKYFGRYCSKNKTKCNEIIEYDYGVNSLNKNNPKIYEYSLCFISNEEYYLKEKYEIEFNEEVIGNCLIEDIYNLDSTINNISQYKVNCSFNDNQLDKFPLLKHFNPFSFTFYNNAFKDLNILTNDLLNISEIDLNLEINVNKVKDYCILNESYALIILSCNVSSPKSEIERMIYDEADFNNFQIESLLNNKFDNILENDMNIIFADYNLNESDENGFRELELFCLIEGNFTKKSNIVVKNEFIYKTFYNNYTIIWRNKTLANNIVFNGTYGIFFIKPRDYYQYNNFYYSNRLSFRLNIYSIYNFSFYDENEENSDSIIFNIKINKIKSEDNQLFCRHPYSYKHKFYVYDIYCESYELILKTSDFITFEESNYKIKNKNNKVLKVLGLNNISYKHDYSHIISFNLNSQFFCNDEGFTFNLSYYMYSYFNENISNYMISNFIDPSTNETINGTCKFNYNIGPFNSYNQELSCIVKSPLIDINSIYFRNTCLDKKNNSLPTIKIEKDYIDFHNSIFCAKNVVFTINKIKEADCVDNTYQFKLIGTLSKEIKKMNKIFIKDFIGNDLKIYCNNLSFYEKNNSLNYYSFNCYVVNDTSDKEYLNITLLNRPLFSDIITIKYSSEYKNIPLILKYKCNNGNIIKYRFREIYNEFNTTINSINDLFDDSPDIDYNIFSFKLLLEIDGYEKGKLSDLYDKYYKNYLTIPIKEPLGVSFCYLKEKNISRIMILECYGIVHYNDLYEEKIIFRNINSLNIHGNDKYSQNITLLGLINQNIDENNIVYPKYIVDSISTECFNNLYRFNVTGVIGNNDYNDETIPKSVKLNLENDLWANCEILIYKEIPKLITECNVISNISLNGMDIKFNKSKLEIDDKNMIIDGLYAFLKATNEIIELNVTCKNSNPLDDNIEKTDINNNIDNSTKTMLPTIIITESSENLINSTIFEIDEPTIKKTSTFENIETDELTINKTSTFENIETDELTINKTSTLELDETNEPTINKTSTFEIDDPTINKTSTFENVETNELIINKTSILENVETDESLIYKTNVFENVETDEIIIDNTPVFIYGYFDYGCSEDLFIFNIYGNLTNDYNILNSGIELEININNNNSNITCNLEKIQDKNVTHKFKCNFKFHQYFNLLYIHPKGNSSNLKIVNWEKDLIIFNEKICYKEIIYPINYSYSNVCNSYSQVFSFEIKMNSTIKKGSIKNDSLALNISKPNFIDKINCSLASKNLSSNVILKCEINNLSQENRIIDGIFINGIRKDHIFFDEYFITDNNQYIKINDLYGAKFNFLECPQDFEIAHCKELNKAERKCLKCHKNYYLNENKDECLTCSQLNEGCSSCNNDGICKKCLTGFNINEDKCEIKDKECEQGKYGPECKTCEEIDSNCEKCSKSGFCLKCAKGYYLSGIDEDSKCIKCLSTCKECESINKCTKCNDGLLLNSGSCDSCLLYIDGCEKCTEIDKCNKCYNTSLLNYILNNNKLCEKQKKEDKKNDKTKLKFERFDSYQKEDNILHFKSHFLLLDNILFNTKLFISIIIQMKKIITGGRFRYLRPRVLDDDIISVQKDIICDQYGDTLGNSNGGYLANYKCSFDENENEDEDYEVLSIEPTKMEIKDKDNIAIQDFETEEKAIDVNEIETSSLDEEYNSYTFNKMTIRNVSDVILNDQLTFNIIVDLDSQIKAENEYEISLKDNQNKIVSSTCKFKTTENNLDNQIISCSSKIDENIEYLTFENGLFASKIDFNDKIIVSSSDGVKVPIPEKKRDGGLSTGAIIGIAAACLIIVVIITILIIKFKAKKKGNPEEPLKNSNEKIYNNKGKSKDYFLSK